MRILVLILMLALSACMSPKMAEEYNAGRLNFEAGNYPRAFHELLPLAVKGKIEAQYAVGYMYYYGYGVSQDNESGMFWMEKAAAQNYPPAMQALKMLQQTSPQKLSTNSVSTSPLPLNVLSKNAEVIAEEGKRTAATVKSSGYTLQLMGAYDIATLQKVRAGFILKNETHIWHTHYQNRDWYVLTYGQYETAKIAKTALKHSAYELKNFSPWVRSVENLESV